LHKHRRTNVIEVNHWANVTNKPANINVTTAVYTLVNGVIAHQKQQISKKVILSSMTLPKCQCTAEQYHFFDICCF